jgi:uncharacterized protein (TIGR02596 family)
MAPFHSMNERSKVNRQARHQCNAARLQSHGFTLIEMLVVIGIVALLLVVAAPAMFKGVQATKLSGAGERLLGALSEAQQMASSRNHPVEMRFYKYNGLFPDSVAFRGYQLFRISTNAGSNAEVATKISECAKLPDGIMISTAANLSPILSGAGIADSPNAAGMTNSGVIGATYIAIRFMTDGTCRKVGTSNQGLATLTIPPPPDFFMTIVEDDGKAYSGTAVPKNFFTIQTDPWTGKSRSYRPGF